MLQSLPDSLNLAYDASVVIHLLRIGGIIILAFITLKLVDSALKRLRLLVPPGDARNASRVEQRVETLRFIIRSVAKTVLTLVLFLTVSSELGFNIGPVLASAGIVGLAIGFGAQSLVKDIIAGFFILFEDQYGVADVVKIGELQGAVERMTLRVTVLRDVEGRVHVIPNGNIPTVTVLTKEWARAVVEITIPHSVALGTAYAALRTVNGRLALDLQDSLIGEPKIVGVERLSEDGTTIRLTVRTFPLKQFEVAREWRFRIKEAFDQQGIPFPQKPFVEEKRGQAT